MKKFISVIIIIIILVIMALVWQINVKKETTMEPSLVSNMDTGNAEQKKDLIRVFSPQPNDVIKNSIDIKGEARGNWFFEASFPIKLINTEGKEVPLSQGYIMTSANWMTTDFVPFEQVVTFHTQKAGKGKLILMKDNPSGLPQNADELVIPISFE
ncbi:MAG: Gmad2 immunoglobulin-like domain-containing protein [Candidatus Pacebacteria bacterium]|nr:Gmad2 immunoglobulin-like domain-containing protein [Candidatus Paceibacterota bacterium]